MSDTPDLLVPDRTILSLEDAKKPVRPRTSEGKQSDWARISDVKALRDDVFRLTARIDQGIADASLAVGQKIFDQVADETSELLERMHHVLRQEILADIEARSLRGRATHQWYELRRWARAHLVGLGLVSPIVLQPDVKIVDVEAEAEQAVAEAFAHPTTPMPATEGE